MADRAKAAKSAIYPDLSRASTVRRQMAAAAGARLPALGPGTGGDGAVARRRLRRLLWLLQPSPRRSNVLRPLPTTAMSRSMMITSRSAWTNVPTLAGVLRVDIGRAPRARTCLATSDK